MEAAIQAQTALRTYRTMNDSGSPNSLTDEHWLVQYCLFGPKRGNLAVMPAADAIRQNIAEARRPVARNYWVTVGLACNENEAKETRRTIRLQLVNGNQGSP